MGKLITALILILILSTTPVSAQGTFVTTYTNDGFAGNWASNRFIRQSSSAIGEFNQEKGIIHTQYVISGSAEDEINQAIDDLEGIGGIVELSKGEFPITASGVHYIKLHQSNVILEGQGQDTILYGMSGGNNVIVELLALEGEQVENVGIRNLVITGAPDSYVCGLGIGTLDITGTLTNAFAEDLWIHDVAWHPDVGGGKGITMGSFEVGSVDGVCLNRIKVWDCDFYGIDTSHNYVTGGIRNLEIENTCILRSNQHNLYILGVDGVRINNVTTNDSVNRNGAVFNFCNDVRIRRLRSTGNGARGFLAGQSSNLNIRYSLFKDNESSGADIDDCTGYIYLFRSRVIGNEVGMDVDNSIVRLRWTVVRNNELDYRVINGGEIY